jgi:hypothetical protein
MPANQRLAAPRAQPDLLPLPQPAHQLNETGVELLWNRRAVNVVSLRQHLLAHCFIITLTTVVTFVHRTILAYYPDSLAVRLNCDLRAQTIQQEAQRAKPSPHLSKARQLFSAVQKSLSNGPSLLRQSTAPFQNLQSLCRRFIGIVVRHKLNSEPLRLFLGGFDDLLPLSAAS